MPRTSRFKRLRAFLTITKAAWAAATIALIGNLITFFLAWNTISSREAGLQADRKLDWQRAIVFSIIQERFVANKAKTGVSVEDIRNDYLSKHTADAAIIKQ